MSTIEIAIAHRNESLFRSRKNAVVYESEFNHEDLIFFCFFFLIKQKKESRIKLNFFKMNFLSKRSTTNNRKLNTPYFKVVGIDHFKINFQFPTIL